MNTAKILGRLSGRSRSARPPMSGPILESGQWSSAPDESHGITLYLEEITVSFDGFVRAVPEQIYELFPVLKRTLRRRGGDLSGGQQQQLAIVRALILDEPTE